MLGLWSAIANYVAQGQTLTASGQRKWLDQRREPVPQPGEASIPVPPLQAFAVHYQADIVVESQHPRWQMHEFARVAVAGRTLWIVPQGAG